MFVAELSQINGCAVDPSGRFSARSVSDGVVGNSFSKD